MPDTPPSSLQSLRSNLEKLDSTDLSSEAQASLNEALLQVTEVERQYQALAQALEKTRQDKAKYISVVTHELRLPLTSIRGFSDLILQGVAGPVSEQQITFLNTIRSNVDRMSSLISMLADMSHAETGRLKFTPVRTAISTCVEEALRSLRGKIEEKGQVLEVELPHDLPDMLVDPNRLQQIVAGLVNNAQAYTPSGGTISVRLRSREKDLYVEVQDTGLGISQDDQARLFMPFFRSEEEAIREQPGWGLSLHVARLLVDRMGGQIGVESTLGQGSRFWFSLPYKP